MKDSKNERLACDAVVKCLEELTGEVGSDRRRPDKEKGGDGKVDMTIKLGGEEYAIEHTRLEAFEGEIKMERVTIKKVLKLLQERIGDGIPGPSYYSVSFAADCTVSAGRKGEKELEEVVEWVRKGIEILHERKWCRQGLREQPHVGADWIDMCCKRDKDFNWDMSVVRWPCAEADGVRPGSLQINPFYWPGRPKKWEEKGRERVERGYRNKVPKLKKCKEAGARTLLVFESRDIRGDLCRGEVCRLARQHREVLDEVYLLEDGPFGWCVVTVKRGDKYHEKELGSLSWHHLYEIGSVKKGDLSERLGLPKWYIKAFGGEEFFEQEYPSSWDGWRPAIVSESGAAATMRPDSF